MNRFLFVALAACSLISSCKKDDSSSSETTKYVQGTLTFEMPAYVKYGGVYPLNPVGAYLPGQTMKPDGTYPDIVGYYFVNPLTNTNDTTKYAGDETSFPPGRTDKIYDFKITKDTLGTLSLTGYAFSAGYYSTTSTYNFTIVSETESLKGVKSYPDDGVVTIDGTDFPTVTINGKQWMRKNLFTASKGVGYSNCEAMIRVLGSFYDWNEAQTVCPEGWELPSVDDWNAVYAMFGNKVSALFADPTFNGEKMWSFWYQVGNITDDSHLSVVPCGYGMENQGDHYFRGMKNRAVFWTSESDGNNGVFVDFYENRNEITRGSAEKSSILFNVRCKQK